MHHSRLKLNMAEPAGPGLRERKDLPASECWDLSKLYATEEDWEKDLERFRELAEKIPSFKGTLGQSVEGLTRALVFLRDFGLLEERLSTYAAGHRGEKDGLVDRTSPYRTI